MFCAAMVCLGVELFCLKVLHLDNPMYTWPLRKEIPRFPDLMFFYPRFRYLHTAQFFAELPGVPQVMYPAPGVVVYSALYAFAPHMLAAYLSFGIGAIAFAAVLWVRALHRRGMAIGTAAAVAGVGLMCCYPVWYALSQANLEIVVWVLLAGGTALFLSGRGYAAAVCFGAAASLKLYPAVFLVLPLLRRQYLQAMAGAVAGAVLSVASLLFVGPTVSVAYHGVQRNLNLFRRLYMLQVRNESGLDHSAFGLMKLLVRHHSPEWMSPWLTLYLAVMALVALVLLIWRARQLPAVNQVAFCTLVCVLFPPTSFEYTLLHVMTIFGLLVLVAVDAGRKGRRIPGLHAAVLLCAATMASLPELIYHVLQLDGAVKCLLLIALLGVCLRYPFGEAMLEPKTERGHQFQAVPALT